MRINRASAYVHRLHLGEGGREMLSARGGRRSELSSDGLCDCGGRSQHPEGRVVLEIWNIKSNGADPE